MKNLYIIGYGLAGGFGGIHEYEVIKAGSLVDAENYAWEKACYYYETHIDDVNLRSLSCIMREEDIEDENEAQIIFEEERENWLDYVSFEYNEENMEEIKGYYIYNPYEN